MYYQNYRPPAQPPQQPQQPPQTPGQMPGGQRPPLPPRQQGPVRRSRRPNVFVWVALFAIAAAVLIGVGVFRFRRGEEARQKLVAQVDAVQQVFLPNLYVDGIHLGGMTPEQGIAAVQRQIIARQSSWNLRLTYQGHVFTTLQYASLGVETDMEKVYALLSQLYQMGKLAKNGTYEQCKQEMDALAETPYYAYTSQSDITDTYLDGILAQIQGQLTYPASDAYLFGFYPEMDDPFLIQGESYGSALDVAQVKGQILDMAASGQSGDLEMIPQAVAPAVTTADIRSQVSLMHEAITPVSNASTEERTSNIRVAFASLNGQKVEPGKTLSFNNLVGPRTFEKGYKYAIEYVNGMEEPGIGGGVCQASTTLYLAAIQSGLEITKRESHADEVSYTTFGQDATVMYTRDRKIDFAFKNNTNSTIYITAKVQEYKKNKFQCVVRIYGPDLGNTAYRLRTQITETLHAPLEPIYQKDVNHTYVTYKDQEPYLTRKARDGYIAETYLQRWEKGVMTGETLVSRDTCKARAAVYLTGTLSR